MCWCVRERIFVREYVKCVKCVNIGVYTCVYAQDKKSRENESCLT